MSDWRDPKPARVSFGEWQELFESIPDELVERYHYFPPNTEAWSKYLFPPQTFAMYGARHLRRLRFDNSLAALRLWGFVQNETERLFRARQTGRRVIATMGDLGALPVIVNSFPGCVAFYPDCIWWTPFVMESKVLFDAAAERGIGDATCFSRAALGAFAKHSYFPDPELVIASTGASCDDYAGVEQLAADIAREVLWVEEPMRRECRKEASDAGAGTGHDRNRSCDFGSCPRPTDPAAIALLVAEYRRVIARLEELTGHSLSEDELRAGVRRANRVRRLVERLRELAYHDAALPALEMMVVEFGNLHYYSDSDEWPNVLEHLLATAEERVRAGTLPLAADALRVAWVTPPADPLLLTYIEDSGARVVGTEYVINQALATIDETRPPLEAIAESFMAASLIGSSRSRADSVISQARDNRAEGVIISNILGGSHCSMESGLIADYVRRNMNELRGHDPLRSSEPGSCPPAPNSDRIPSPLPVLEFDVAPPAREIDRQLQTRIDAFLEVLRSRR